MVLSRLLRREMSHGMATTCLSVFAVLCLWTPALLAQDAPPQGDEPAQTEGGEEQPQARPAVQKRPKLLILPTNSVEGKVTPLVPERIDESMRQRLKEDGKVVVMPSFTDIRKDLAGRGVSSAVIYEAEQLYASGIGLLTAGENEKAMEAFQRAIELMEQNIADVTNYGILTDTLSNLALAYQLMGYDVDSRKRMQQFAHLKPEATLSVDKFPKELLEVLSTEQAKIKKAGPGKLVINTETPGAKVFIDGVERGVTPLTLEDIGFGYHYLVLRDAQGKVHTEQIRVRGKGKEQQVNASLKGAGEAAAPAGSEEMPSYYNDLLTQINTGKFTTTELQPYLMELSKQSGAPYISWVLVYKTNTHYMAAPFIWRAEDGVLVAPEEKKFNLELSDLVLGVNRMSREMAVAAQEMPEDDRVTDVVVGAPVAVAVVSPTVTEPDGPTTSPVVTNPPDPEGTGTGQGADTSLKPLDPIEEPSKENRRWKYVGAGAVAIVVIGGVVAGSVLLANSNGGSEPPTNTGFSAEVSW